MGRAGRAIVANICGLLAIACFAIAAGAVQQHRVGWNEASHYAQVRAFDHGTPVIDPYQRTTGDKAVFGGHYYSDKAPGLGLLTLPAYHVVRASGITHSEVTVHILVLFGSVLPAVVMLLLAYWLVERRDHGQGAAVAITLGLATLVLPFATLFFSHVLSACLGFAAYCVLWRDRELEPERGPRLGLIAGAGALAGYGVGAEYPLALLAVLLGVYAVWRRDPLKPGLHRSRVSSGWSHCCSTTGGRSVRQCACPIRMSRPTRAASSGSARQACAERSSCWSPTAGCSSSPR